MTVHIKKPIMNKDGQRCVGIADYRLKYESNFVEVVIDYITKKENMRIYPNPLYIPKTNVLKYPVQYVKDTKLYIVPIADMKENKR